MWSRLQNVGEFMDDHVVRTARQSNPARSMPCHVSRTMATSCEVPHHEPNPARGRGGNTAGVIGAGSIGPKRGPDFRNHNRSRATAARVRPTSG